MIVGGKLKVGGLGYASQRLFPCDELLGSHEASPSPLSSLTNPVHVWKT